MPYSRSVCLQVCSAMWLVVVIGLFGCGPAGGAKVSGTVKQKDGTPLAKARITARCESTGRWASGVSDESGNFILGTEKAGEGLPPGEYTVIVVEDQGDWDHPSPPKISKKYANPVLSGLQFRLEGDDTVLEWTLDSK